MSDEVLLDNLNDIYTQKETYLLPANIKDGVTVLGVTGTLEELKGETKSVTPSTTAQTITPSSGKNGITQVNVSAVTSTIDNNIQTGNIKDGVSILGVTGTYAGTTPTGTINITTNGTHDVTNYASAEVNVQGAGGGSDVLFYDYDGTLITSYSKASFLALTEMPANPTHTGLVADGWNWTLNDAKAYVTNLGKLIIGQNYHTVSGKTEIFVELNATTGLTVTVNLTGNKDWGDNTTDTATSHTYSTAGKYTITCDTTSISSAVFGQASSTPNTYCTEIRLSGVTSMSASAFTSCTSLLKICLPATFRTFNSNSLDRCFSLKALIFPSGITSLPSSCFANDYSLSIVSCPKSLTTFNGSVFSSCRSLPIITASDILVSLGGSAFYNCSSLDTFIYSTNGGAAFNAGAFEGCSGLKEISLTNDFVRLYQGTFKECNALTTLNLSKNITRIDSSAFYNTYSLRVLDFSDYTSIPSNVNAAAFTSINPLLKIIVPDDLYATWKTTSNWSQVANNIVKASEA